MAVDHRGINAFLNVARLGSVGAAASALSLTQPAVSRTLRKLEQQLGVQLFLRHSTGRELTAFGQSLLPHATLLETGLHRALEEIDLLRGASKGMARVGILPSLVPDILPTVLNNVRVKLPGIQLHVVEAPNHQLTRALLRGEIDFAIAAVPPDLTEENIRVTPLVNDEICIVARTAHPIMRKKSPTQTDLREYNWALQERGGLIWRYFQALFASANLESPVVTLTANSVQTLKSVIVSSDLITMLPRISIRNEEKNRILRPVPLRAVLSLALRGRRDASPGICRAVYRSLVSTRIAGGSGTKNVANYRSHQGKDHWRGFIENFLTRASGIDEVQNCGKYEQRQKCN